jgi:starch-binding outer membrane protein, SusD/RagB family
MKARYKKLLAISFSLICFLFISCEKEIDQEPVSQLSDTKFWKTNNDAAAAVASIYDGMQKHYGNRHFYWGEFRSDNYVSAGTAAGFNLSITKNAITSDFGGAVNWSEMYRMIARANLCIKNIPNIPGYNPELLAEAHFLRAYAYFDAIRVWGDVPLFTEPVTVLDESSYRPREKKEKIMGEVILPDLQAALRLMTTRTSQFRASRSAVLNLQGEVAMWQKNWEVAKAAFAEVENYKAFTLAATRTAWNDQFFNDLISNVQTKKMVGTELIFSIRYNQLEDGDRSGIYGLHFAGLPSFYVSPELETKWAKAFPIDSIGWYAAFPNTKPLQTTATGQPFYGDYRYFESREQGRDPGAARVAKWNKININPTFDDTDIHVYRYSSMVYNQAEVEAMLNNFTGAVALLNRVRAARQLPAIKTVFTNQEALIDAILDEKQYETLGEGDRWWDLVRTNRAIKILGPINKMDANTIFWPIFRNHILDNPKLVQNPGYN